MVYHESAISPFFASLRFARDTIALLGLARRSFSMRKAFSGSVGLELRTGTVKRAEGLHAVNSSPSRLGCSHLFYPDSSREPSSENSKTAGAHCHLNQRRPPPTRGDSSASSKSNQGLFSRILDFYVGLSQIETLRG